MGCACQKISTHSIPKKKKTAQPFLDTNVSITKISFYVYMHLYLDKIKQLFRDGGSICSEGGRQM
jgi:hypothetical protein